jgi:hypothetical protein
MGSKAGLVPAPLFLRFFTSADSRVNSSPPGLRTAAAATSLVSASVVRAETLRSLFGSGKRRLSFATRIAPKHAERATVRRRRIRSTTQGLTAIVASLASLWGRPVTAAESLVDSDPVFVNVVQAEPCQLRWPHPGSVRGLNINHCGNRAIV